MDAQPDARSPRLAGGHLLTAISTSIVGILRDHYGRGPMRAKTYVLDDIIVVVMRGSGFTPLEKTIMNSGSTSWSNEANTTPLKGNGPNDSYQTTRGTNNGTAESVTPFTVATAPSITSADHASTAADRWPSTAPDTCAGG